MLGNVDAGKSTLLGVLTHDELDNGRGRARLNLFRHLHEIQTGRTSSISHEILGFSSKGEVIQYLLMGLSTDHYLLVIFNRSGCFESVTLACYIVDHLVRALML